MNLKSDLDEYLSSNNKKKSGGVGSVLGKLKLPTFALSKNSSSVESEALLQESESSSSSWFPSLNKKQRILGFSGSLSLGIICFVLASFYFPILILQSRKFALLFSLGSLFSLCSFSFLYGPAAHFKGLFGSVDRLPFTTAYFVTLLGALYSALALQSAILTCIFAVAQVLVILSFLLSYIPGGQTGLRFMGRISSAFCKKTDKTLSNKELIMNAANILKASGFILFRHRPADPPSVEYLLMKASYGSRHWTPPKGHMDPEESLLGTALRETLEESGLNAEKDFTVIPDFQKTLAYEVKHHRDGVVRKKETVYFLGKMTPDSAEVKLSEEHTDFKWLTIDEISEYVEFQDFKSAIIDCEDFIKAKKL